MTTELQNYTLAKSLTELAEKIHYNISENGFWELRHLIGRSLRNEDKAIVEDALKSQKLALIHSEVSEVLEALRIGNPPDEKLPQYSAEAVELADVLIRLLDYAGAYNIPIGDILIEKTKFNTQRERKHGKRF